MTIRIRMAAQMLASIVKNRVAQRPVAAPWGIGNDQATSESVWRKQEITLKTPAKGLSAGW